MNKMVNKDKSSKGAKKGISVSKKDDFSAWYSELVQKAELADLRYNIKGFVCYLPWAVMTIKKMYEKYENLLEKKDHLPLTMPSLIPESNFNLESEHVEGFTPEVFWVTEAGSEKLEERLALRPTSETALYKMYSYWIRSYKDLPFKRYQSCQVWRYEGKATRPFFRAREFHWIESHNVFSSLKEAKAQVKEDMETTYQMLQDEFAIPVIFFQRPEWDKFAGAVHTYAADALTEAGKVIQLPSTHLLGQNFSEPFGVKFKNKEGKDKLGYITCYGPAISRIYGAMISILGDDNGLILPFDLSPVQAVIVPIFFEKSKKSVMEGCRKVEDMLKEDYKVNLDERDLTPGEKFYEWELKGVPLRIEIGPKDIEKDQAVVVVRHSGKKEFIKLGDLKARVKEIADDYTHELKNKHLKKFEDYIETAETVKDIKKTVSKGKIARAGLCSIEMDGYKCAEAIEKEANALVRGKKADGESSPEKKCVVCGKKAKETVYIARSY